MLQSNHFELLDKLRFGKDSDERKNALQELVFLEHEAQFDESDMIQLLNDNDPVIQVYAIGAIGRLKLSSAIPELKKRYLESTDPLMLNEMLMTFLQFESNEFLDIVLEKLRKLAKKPWLFQKRLPKTRGTDEKEFLLNHILVPSLKYIRQFGNPMVVKTVKGFLNHKDGNVRWQTLKLYDSLEISIKTEVLKKMAASDPNPLVREQADILISKRK